MVAVKEEIDAQISQQRRETKEQIAEFKVCLLKLA